MKARSYLALLAFGSGCLVVAHACSASNHTSGQFTGGADPGGSGPGSGTTMDTSASTATLGVGGFTGASVTGGGCDTRCSADLHNVVDCNNNVVMACPADQGCGSMGCVPACESAKQNKSSIGCEYYSIDPDVIQEAWGACFAAFIANTWTTPVTLTVDYGGMPLDISQIARVPSGNGQSITYTPLPGGQLMPGEVAILFLGGNGFFAPCPSGITPGVNGDAAAHGTTFGKAFHITSSAPVVAYDIFPYGGGSAAATSATLLLPISAWDTNYIAVDAFRKDVVVSFAQPDIAIVAQEDGTQVTISPTAAIQGGAGIAPTGQGVPATYNMSKGQVLQFTQDAELIGSPIQSNKPIGVWGGATCLNIDVDKVACDSAHQQIPPVKALGSEYIGVRYRNRFDGQEETPPWRIVGAVDATNLTWDPAPPAGAPLILKSGQVAEFRSAGGFSVKSQDDMHPFYMAAHMTGCEEVMGGNGDCRGDPEFVNVVPPQQYLGDYVFFTDPTYPETNLVVIRSKGPSGFQDVTLDCAGNLSGWQPIGNGGKYEYTRIDLVRHDFAKQGNCDNGRHEIKSKGLFGLTVWGWGNLETTAFFTQAVSYAYPAGASVQPINQVVVPPVPK